MFLMTLLTVFALYDLNQKVESRSISFENPTGERGNGGKAKNHLGVGRKGAPARGVFPGKTVVLCDIKGAGTITHIWMTGTYNNISWIDDSSRFKLLRSTVIRAYWDGQEYPSIECPLGDFMGIAQARVAAYQSAVHSVGELAAFNMWLPMPFTKSAKITITNESDKAFEFFYQIDYTFNDKHPKDVGRLHTCFRRENPTTLKQDFEIMPKRTGKGRYMGALMGVRTLEDAWWGEGEIKIYKDGDSTFPTICGTGAEDYICQSYGVQRNAFMYHGCNMIQDGKNGVNSFISMYRWHLPDPIFWDKECRITIQQIGWNTAKSGTPNSGRYERQDDWSAAAFWYEPIPSQKLPDMPNVEQRIADLDSKKD